MKTLGLVMALCLCGVLSAGAQTAAETPGKNSVHETVPGTTAWEKYDAVATLLNPQGEKTGRVIVVEGADGLMLLLQAHGLPPGWHAFHLHQSGKCEAPSFESAGGHYHPGKGSHGLLHEEGAAVGVGEAHDRLRRDARMRRDGEDHVRIVPQRRDGVVAGSRVGLLPKRDGEPGIGRR